VHDGQLDSTNATDLVTVSRNLFEDHDKTMLIGSSNSSTVDPGKLRVSLHHNIFRGVQERGAQGALRAGGLPLGRHRDHRARLAA
jgi:pectate lyase